MATKAAIMLPVMMGPRSLAAAFVLVEVELAVVLAEEPGDAETRVQPAVLQVKRPVVLG
jgi:hypothetical protein